MSRISLEFRLMPHHAHTIDRWDDATGSNLYEHLAGVNDLAAEKRLNFGERLRVWGRLVRARPSFFCMHVWDE
jgi:hypothetical protein